MSLVTAFIHAEGVKSVRRTPFNWENSQNYLLKKNPRYEIIYASYWFPVLRWTYRESGSAETIF